MGTTEVKAPGIPPFIHPCANHQPQALKRQFTKINLSQLLPSHVPRSHGEGSTKSHHTSGGYNADLEMTGAMELCSECGMSHREGTHEGLPSMHGDLQGLRAMRTEKEGDSGHIEPLLPSHLSQA